MITETARAKLNLTLHVTGQRHDGYHLLDSLVAFAEYGDQVTLTPGPLSLSVTGPFADGLHADDDNLCLRAARLIGGQAAVALVKRLPVASGIGGGSADAAAVLRGFARQGLALPDTPQSLGADVPVCLASAPARMRGVGEQLAPIPPLPPLPVLLVNPGIAIPTPQVFAALPSRNNPPMPRPDWRDADGLIAFLSGCRNDMQNAAIGIAPAIADVLTALDRHGARLARMSGSGATCFGLFDRPAQADEAAQALRAYGWWAVATELALPPVPA